MKKKKVVITYGTFDLFHEGHYRLLKRAKELGDYLIVGVTSEKYDKERGKLNVAQSLAERIENVKKTGFADLVIVEEYEGQKIDDIQKYNADIFAIGSDWIGKFDYLKEYCEVVYLERTKGISSTQLRNERFSIIKMGVVGYGRIAERFILESKFVSGINIEGVYGLNKEKMKVFCEKNELAWYTDSYIDFLNKVDAVYTASPHSTHFEYAYEALLNRKHVLCEKPLTLSREQAKQLYNLAQEKQCVLLEGIKTAYCPGFKKLISIAKSGIIGNIKFVDATFTKLIKDKTSREFDKNNGGGSVTELASYVLLPAVKIFRCSAKDISFSACVDPETGVDIFAHINIAYDRGVFSGKVGIGAKAEGSLIIGGTEGYIYVPSPWWKTEYFEVRDDNGVPVKKYLEVFHGDGLRYEIAEFVHLIQNKKITSYNLKPEESIFIIDVIEKFFNDEKVIKIPR